MKLHHLCIQTDKYKESLEFYTKIMGFKLVKETENFHSRYYNTWLELDGLMIELQTNKVDQDLKEFSNSSKGIVHFCFQVDDLENEYNRIKTLGYNKFKSKNGTDIYIVEGGKLFKLIAPEGTIIEFRDNPGI